MRSKYRTVRGYGEAKLEINRSLFIASVNRAEAEEQATAFIAEISRKYPDANHDCFAYVVGAQDEYQKAGDDGEPSGTAGKPILEVIKKNRLSDTVVVVTRYFGGIKLGAGGLIRAYGKSASEGILSAGLIERTLHSRIGVDIEYSQLGLVENALLNRGYAIQDRKFTNTIQLIFLEEQGREERARQLITDLTAGTAQFFDVGVDYMDKSIDS